MNELRRWIMLVEAATASDYYVHVSPLKNQRSIVANGLLPNLDGGNYAGFETALSGVYVTREPDLIRNHINARQIEHGYLLVLVQVPHDQGTIDEDVMDIWFHRCVKQVVGDARAAIDRIDPEDEIWKQVTPCFVEHMGPADPAVVQQHPGFIEEFIEAVIRENLYGEDVAPEWWEDAKTLLMQMFPNVAHPSLGNRYSLRLPAIGYSGAAHIVAVVAVRNNVPNIVKGAVPSAAQSLIDSIIR